MIKGEINIECIIRKNFVIIRMMYLFNFVNDYIKAI